MRLNLHIPSFLLQAFPPFLLQAGRLPPSPKPWPLCCLHTSPDGKTRAQVFRQKDADFVRLLDDVRYGRATKVGHCTLPPRSRCLND